MTYTPQRITIKNILSENEDEIELDKNAIQRNLDLISKETKELKNEITQNQKDIIQTGLVIRTYPRFVNSFLFGG